MGKSLTATFCAIALFCTIGGAAFSGPLTGSLGGTAMIAQPQRAQSPWVRQIACSPTETQQCVKCVREGGTPDSCKVCKNCR